MKKKMLSMALALIMCLSLMPSALAYDAVNASDKFTDVPSNAWYLGELNYAVANGYISGTSATTFSPDATITRGQFVTILGRMLGVSTASGKTKFTDVKEGSWYAPYVAWAADKGYVNGTSSTTFAPEANITVEQMATILANYIDKTGTMLACYTGSVTYRDAATVSSWAAKNVELMRQYNLLVTDALGHVNPHKAVTRAEGTVTLVRFAVASGIGEKLSPVDSVTIEMLKPEAYSDDEYAAAVGIRDSLIASGKLTSSMTQKQKARVYYDWLIQKCSYGESANAHTAYGALVEGRVVCQGYAEGYKLLLMLEGIECDIVAYTPAAHGWNTAVLDGVLYHIDATWGDDSKKSEQDKYFCMTEEAAYARFGGKIEVPGMQIITGPDMSEDDLDDFNWGDFDWSSLFQ